MKTGRERNEAARNHYNLSHRITMRNRLTHTIVCSQDEKVTKQPLTTITSAIRLHHANQTNAYDGVNYQTDRTI